MIMYQPDLTSLLLRKTRSWLYSVNPLKTGGSAKPTSLKVSFPPIVRILLYSDVGENTAIIELPLHDASKRGNVQFASELLNAGIPSLKIGVSANALDKAGNAPIHWACRGGHAEIVTLLLSKGATNMSQNRMGDTPLHLAAYGNHFEAVQTLLDSGVTSVKNKAGSLPSDLAKVPS